MKTLIALLGENVQTSFPISSKPNAHKYAHARKDARARAHARARVYDDLFDIQTNLQMAMTFAASLVSACTAAIDSSRNMNLRVRPSHYMSINMCEFFCVGQ